MEIQLDITQLSIVEKQDLIDKLLDISSLKNPARIQNIIDSMPQRIAKIIQRGSDPRSDVLGIIDACEKFDSGFNDFYQAIKLQEGGETIQFRSLTNFAKELSDSQQEMRDFFVQSILPKIKEYPRDDKSLIPKKLHTTLVILLGVVFFISIVSLLLSYRGNYSSIPWRLEYGRNGWAIELFRSLIIIISTFTLLDETFTTELCEIIGIFPVSSLYKKIVYVMRFVTIVMFVFTSIFVIEHHLIGGPHFLSCKHPKYISESYESFYRPYLIYLPYSLINYVLIGVVLVLVSIYSGLKDVIYLRECHLILQDNIDLLVESQSNEPTLIKLAYNKILENFNDFSSFYIERIGRYSYLFVSVAILLAYEELVGKQTLSDEAYFWIIVGYLLLSIVLFVIISAISLYERSFNSCESQLNHLSFSNSGDKTKIISSQGLLKKVLERNAIIYFGIILLAITFLYRVRFPPVEISSSREVQDCINRNINSN